MATWTSTTGSDTYSNVSAHSGVEAASPHRLVAMLMDGALGKIAAARGYMERGETATKGEMLSLAISIIEGLRGSLDTKAGGELANNLEALYEYMANRLLEANLTNDVRMLDEVHNLLSELRSGWAAIGEPVSERRNEPASAAISSVA